MSQSPSVLLACSNPDNLRALHTVLTLPGLTIREASDVIEAERQLSPAISLVLCEDCLPKGGYRELMRKIRLAQLDIPLVVSSVSGSTEQYLEAMRLGAEDYITPPYSRETVGPMVQRRREPRLPLMLPVEIYGADADGLPFFELGRTQNISSHGARLAGIRSKLRPKDLIGVNCCEKATMCRVVWVGELDKSGGREIGIESLDPVGCNWNFANCASCSTEP